MTDLAHPAPKRHRASLGLLTTALFGVPCLWALRLVINYGIDSHFCFPSETRRNVLPGWAWPTLLGIDFATVAVAITAMVISFHYWRSSRDEAVGHPPLIETDEGRGQFFAVWGLFIGIGFLIAVLFDLVGLWIVPYAGDGQQAKS